MGDLRLKIFYNHRNKYYGNVSQMCDARKLHSTRMSCYASKRSEGHRSETEDYFMLELDELFKLPKFHESQNRIKKHELLEAFIRFLVQLLHPELDELAWMIYRKFKVQIEHLEKELRILLTILGDSSFIPCDDEHEEFQKLLAEFEAVANEAASFIHSLVFPSDRGLVFAIVYPFDPAYVKLVDDFDVVLNQFDLLKISMMKFVNLDLPSTSTLAFVTPKTTTVGDSLLIVHSLIDDLEDLMSREDNPIASVKYQIERLHQGLIVTLSSIKDIEFQQPSEIGELKEPLMRIGDMAHKAEYVIFSFLVGDAPLWYLINRLTDFNGKIDHIATELVGITNKYKFEGSKVAGYFATQPSLEAKENTEADGVTIGFDDKVIHILDKLVGGIEHLQVFLIFGMPGIGKTTLAKKLYNHPSVIYRFDRISWCVISQTYLRQSILASILIQIASELEKNKILEMDEECLIGHIRKTLKKRRYLIVIDDIWDSNVWDGLQRCFPDDANGSRILLTTRNKDVAPPNSIIYEMPSLSTDQCWELLKKKVFDDEPCPSQLLGIGKKIAQSCRGLPLAVVVVAGVLSTMNSEISTWEEMQKNLASHIFDAEDSSSVMQILELSYKHLPDHLKPCFLYFGAYREDEKIPARQLMRLWITEGFVHKEGGKSREDVAEEYLNQLIDRSLVIVATLRSDGGVKACVIHDLFHDLCLRICEEQKFLKFGICNIDLMLEKHVNSRKAFRHSTSWSYCQHIRSIRGRSLTPILCVRDMRLLRILHTDKSFKYLIGIEHLVNMRYLVIADGNLLASIGRLVNLEYLRVEFYGREVYLPPEIMKMMKLRHIYVERGTARYHTDCDSSQPNNLEHLSGLEIVNLKDEEMLKCSPHLRNLKLSACQRHVDLSFLTQLESLKLPSDTLEIEKIMFPANIRKLTLHQSSSLLLKMSVIGRLENLEILKIRIGYTTTPSVVFWDTSDGEFQKLKYLELDNVDIIQWNVDSSEHFPQLQRLILIDCHYLEEIASEIGEIATLQLIKVKGFFRESLEESAKRIQQEQQDMGNEELKVIISVAAYTQIPTPPPSPKPKVRASNKAKRVLQKLFRRYF